MRRIIAAFISCLVICVQADDTALSTEAEKGDSSSFLAGYLRNAPEFPGMDYEHAAEWWVVDTPPHSALGTRYALSIVEVAYSRQDSDVLYSFAEKHLNENLAVFLQVSQTEQNTPQSHEYIGTGITLNNRWRAGDGIGLGVAHSRSPNLTSQVYPDWESADMAWELTYFGSLLEKVDAQTSVYYIQHPAQDANISDSIAAQLRVHFKF